MLYLLSKTGYFSVHSSFYFCPPFMISASHCFRARTCCYSLCSNKLLLIISRIVFWQSDEPNCVLTRLEHCRKWRVCQELLSAHCFHKKGSPAVCLFWATPVKVPRSPFGVWLNCIKGHVYYLCSQCILAEGDCIRGTCVSTVSVSRLFVYKVYALCLAILARRVQRAFEGEYVFERVYSFRRSIQSLSQCALRSSILHVFDGAHSGHVQV